MTPKDLRLPFEQFRDGQLELASRVAFSPHKATILRAPPGTGKTAIYLTASRLQAYGQEPHRTLILTSTRQLQTQLKKDYKEAGLVDMRGKSNYSCRQLGGKCNDADCYKCPFKTEGCYYYNALYRAKTSDLVVSSYACYLYHRINGQDFEHFDTIVCDEAHLALDWLTTVTSFELSDKGLKRLGIDLPLIHDTCDQATHIAWATVALEELAHAEPPETRALKATAHKLKADLRRFVHHDTTWIIESNGTTISYRPLWPGDTWGHLLHSRGRKLVLCSATVYRKDAERLGLDDVEEISVPSTFPIDNRRIMYYDTTPRVAVNRHTKDIEYRILCDRIHAFLDNHPGIKGIIQSPSYKLAETIKKQSRNSQRLLIATRSNSQLEAFEASDDKVLISPAIAEGVDFPYDRCRFVLFPKVPFPYFGDKLLRARNASCAGYADELTRRTFVQMALRASRAPDDYCIIVLFDAHFKTWLAKASRYLEPWFVEACSTTNELPTLEIPNDAKFHR